MEKEVINRNNDVYEIHYATSSAVELHKLLEATHRHSEYISDFDQAIDDFVSQDKDRVGNMWHLGGMHPFVDKNQVHMVLSIWYPTNSLVNFVESYIDNKLKL